MEPQVRGMKCYAPEQWLFMEAAVEALEVVIGKGTVEQMRQVVIEGVRKAHADSK